MCPLFCHLRYSLAENSTFFMDFQNKEKGTDVLTPRDFA